MIVTIHEKEPELTSILCDFGADLIVQYDYNPREKVIVLHRSYITIRWQVHKRPLNNMVVKSYLPRAISGNSLDTILLDIDYSHKQLVKYLNRD